MHLLWEQYNRTQCNMTPQTVCTKNKSDNSWHEIVKEIWMNEQIYETCTNPSSPWKNISVHVLQESEQRTLSRSNRWPQTHAWIHVTMFHFTVQIWQMSNYLMFAFTKINVKNVFCTLFVFPFSFKMYWTTTLTNRYTSKPEKPNWPWRAPCLCQSSGSDRAVVVGTFLLVCHSLLSCLFIRLHELILQHPRSRILIHQIHSNFNQLIHKLVC